MLSIDVCKIYHASNDGEHIKLPFNANTQRLIGLHVHWGDELWASYCVHMPMSFWICLGMCKVVGICVDMLGCVWTDVWICVVMYRCVCVGYMWGFVWLCVGRPMYQHIWIHVCVCMHVPALPLLGFLPRFRVLDSTLRYMGFFTKTLVFLFFPNP